MSGQPELDKKMYAKYKTGNAAVDQVPDFAVALMQYSRVREPSDRLADPVGRRQGLADGRPSRVAKSAKQALDDNQILVQKALDEAWADAPQSRYCQGAAGGAAPSPPERNEN